MGTDMGTLKPGTTYIYERSGGTIYAREFGQSARTVVGYDHDCATPDGRPMQHHIDEYQLWPKIHRAAYSNPALQEALDRVKIIYNLSRTDE
jgi:hypothetical protein